MSEKDNAKRLGLIPEDSTNEKHDKNKIIIASSDPNILKSQLEEALNEARNQDSSPRQDADVHILLESIEKVSLFEKGMEELSKILTPPENGDLGLVETPKRQIGFIKPNEDQSTTS